MVWLLPITFGNQLKARPMNKFTPPMTLAEYQAYEAEQCALRTMARKPPVEGRDFVALPTSCSPPDENGKPLRVAPNGEPGPGVCIPRNAHVWRQVADFLDAQWLATFGLKRTASSPRSEYFGLSLLQQPK